ncbi:ATP-dependent zinc metalloprotease FtsH [soil metagenome]
MVDRLKESLRPKKPAPEKSGAPAPREGERRPGWPQDPRQRWMTVMWVLAAIALLFVFNGGLFGETQSITFTQFTRYVEQDKIEKVNIGGTTITGSLDSQSGPVDFTTTTPTPNYRVNGLVDKLESNEAEITFSQPSALGSFLIYILPFALIGLLYFFFMRRLRNQMGGGGAGPLSFGRNKAKLYDRTDMKTTFEDVAGVDEVETELVELVDYLRKPEKFAAVGAKIPKGVLLVGPPGTGKTLLARAIAGEAGVPFFYISASEFIELFVGLGAARVRDLFQQARARAPAIVFIDEIDSIGQARAGSRGPQMGSNQEQEQTLQQLLTEMDGFEPNSGVIIVAASNRPEVLDQALLRPGRFDRQIQVNLPDVRGREEILAIHARSVSMGKDADLKVLARRTPGFSGAQLANVINEGALLAARHGEETVSMRDLEEAIDRVVAGLERRSQVLTDNERKLVAYHELGHALVARFVEHSDPVHRISIIPRGIGALGYTQQLPDEERYLMSAPELRDRIAVLLGGRSAEELVFGFATTGAQDDLKRATEIARRMVMEFGMSEKVGPINISDPGARYLSPAFRRGDEVSDETEVAIDREVKAILLEARDKARAVLADHRGDLEGLAERLLVKESLGRRELDEFFADATLPAGGHEPGAQPAAAPVGARKHDP